MSETNGPLILLADDHVLIRDALASVILRRVPGARCECTDTAAETIKAVTRAEWSLLVLDLGLPGGREFEALRQVRALRPSLPILVYSMFPEQKMGVAAIEAGADGYLCKTADRETVAKAVAETLAGDGYRSERLRRLLTQRASGRARGDVALSPRELEVLIELGRGRSNKEIAAGLAISVTSVGTYRTRIMDKLGVSTTADLLRHVIEHRLTRE